MICKEVHVYISTSYSQWPIRYLSIAYKYFRSCSWHVSQCLTSFGYSLQAGKPAVSICTGDRGLFGEVSCGPQPFPGPQFLQGNGSRCERAW